jgi:hypothetical protein
VALKLYICFVKELSTIAIRFIFVLTIICHNKIWAQIRVSTLEIKATHLSATRQGDFMAADIKGNVHRIDTGGKILLTYTPHGQGSIFNIEAWQGIRTLVFFKDFQQIQFLDRFLTYSERIPLPQDVVGFARCMTISSDEQLWLIDDTDFALKKIHSKNLNLISSTPLDLILPKGKYQFHFMREYQNQLYVADSSKGIFVFDNMGNYRRMLPIKASFFTFNGNDLIYFDQPQSRIVYLNVYSLSEHYVDWPTTTMQVLDINNHLVTNNGSQIEIWRKK